MTIKHALLFICLIVATDANAQPLNHQNIKPVLQKSLKTWARHAAPMLQQFTKQLQTADARGAERFRNFTNGNYLNRLQADINAADALLNENRAFLMNENLMIVATGLSDLRLCTTQLWFALRAKNQGSAKAEVVQQARACMDHVNEDLARYKAAFTRYGMDYRPVLNDLRLP